MIVVSTKIYCKKRTAKKRKPHIPYLWANYVIIDENDSSCPLIEG
tara:strand:+ start:1329 stop:1463 length:135 start_codon:yes stop_codon:yes gene_type:complete